MKCMLVNVFVFIFLPCAGARQRWATFWLLFLYLNPFRGKPTYMSPRLKGIPTHMSPKVKGYTDIYVILTYTGTETHVSFIPEIHFFGQGLKLFLPPKGLTLHLVYVQCSSLWTLLNRFSYLLICCVVEKASRDPTLRPGAAVVRNWTSSSHWHDSSCNTST